MESKLLKTYDLKNIKISLVYFIKIIPSIVNEKCPLKSDNNLEINTC